MQKYKGIVIWLFYNIILYAEDAVTLAENHNNLQAALNEM